MEAAKQDNTIAELAKQHQVHSVLISRWKEQLLEGDSEEAGIWGRLQADLFRLLKKEGKLDTDTVIIDGVTVWAFGGGESIGPSLVDRRKSNTKHTLMASPPGSLWRCVKPMLTPATIARFSSWCSTPPKVEGVPNRPKVLPDEAYADRGYDSESTRVLLRWLVIECTSPSGGRRTAAGWGRSAG